MVDGMWPRPEKKQFKEQFSPLLLAMEEALAEVDHSITIEQSPERFIALPGDAATMRLAKIGKRSAYTLSRLPTRAANLFRKEKKAIHYWERTIPLHNLAKAHFGCQLIGELSSLIAEHYRFLSAEYLQIKHWGEQEESFDESRFESNYLEQQFQKVEARLNELLDACLAAVSQSYQADYATVGTMELSAAKFSDAALQKKEKEAHEGWAVAQKKWENTLYALFDEWRSDLDIYLLRHKALDALNEYRQARIMRVSESIDPEIEEILAFIDEADQSLGATVEDLSMALKKINYQAGKKLDKELVPGLSDKLTGQTITNLISRLEISIQQDVEELADEHVIPKTSTYDEPLSDDELRKISPYELIAFETLAAFAQETEQLKKELFASLEKIALEVSDIDHVITFSISSAISLAEGEEKDDAAAMEVAREGLKRARQKLMGARGELNDALNQSVAGAEKTIHAFCESILELTVNENVAELRLRIARAKAAMQAEEVRKAFMERLRSSMGELNHFAGNAYHLASSRLKNLSERFILTASTPTMSREVSDFLTESRQLINELPLVYRRLYQIEPLQDLELFEGRTTELEALKTALASWEQGKYSSTVILGEKWSGLTSFMNYTVSHLQLQYPVHRYGLTKNIHTAEALVLQMQAVLNDQNLRSLDEIIDHLNKNVRRVIILEDIQNLFIRKIDGFKALSALAQLIHRTHDHVFWVCTTTLYTWEYLSKAINIREYFNYHIPLEALTEEQITGIILKRNRISGYDIRFVASPEVEGDKKYRRMNEKQQQEYLKKSFFSSLNAFAKSNVSMALIFWLLSTRRVDDRCIEIGTFSNPNLNFLSVLSMDKVYALHALILHDGLTVQQLAEILSLSPDSAQMIMIGLTQDGIVFETDKVYIVNPIVYRSTVNLLKAKNLIH